MVSSVFHAPPGGKPGNNHFDRIARVLDSAGFGTVFKAGDMVAVKVHWGEPGNSTFTPSFFIRFLVDKLKEVGAKPFVADTNTLYRGERHDAVSNILAAARNGFDLATLGCPVVVADGLRGTDWREVPVPNARYSPKARVASAFAEADSMLVVSHVKGHMVFGFGGAIKNLGMGCAPAGSKQFLHADVRPQPDVNLCVGCGLCVAHCKFAALSMRENPSGQTAVADHNLCTGCGECISVCPHEAIPLDWGGDHAATQVKTVEFAKAALVGKEGRCLFLNFLTDVVPDCDCCDWSDVPLVPDQGYLASTDPVAIDRASIDIINKAPSLSAPPVPPGQCRFRAVHDIDYEPLFRHARLVNMGTDDYRLVRQQ